MAINWFPGHMNKARRLLKARVAKSDMVIEVLDARLPRSSQNPMLAGICRGVPCLRVLTKPDLADPKLTAAWAERLSGQQVRVLELVATDPKNARRVVAACRALVPRRGRPGFPVRVMIAGIPNVGKSTLFNLLVGKRKAQVRDQPAVTRQEQRIDVPGGLSLVDTPGVLWPKLSDPMGAYRLAASGAIRGSVLDVVDVARFLVTWLVERYPHALMQRYGVSSEQRDTDEVLVQIAQRRGCLTRGIGPDMVKASEVLLHEFRAGKLGRVSLEDALLPDIVFAGAAPELTEAERQIEAEAELAAAHEDEAAQDEAAHEEEAAQDEAAHGDEAR